MRPNSKTAEPLYILHTIISVIFYFIFFIFTFSYTEFRFEHRRNTWNNSAFELEHVCIIQVLAFMS